MNPLDIANKIRPLTEQSNKEIFQNIWVDVRKALAEMPQLEKAFHIFWLLGPFILLIERSPADIWLSILAIAFVVRSIIKRDGAWLEVFWVRASFLFLVVCMVSSAFSKMPSYAFSEALAWFRFPLFAMATAFWLGTDRRLLYGMLISTALGMILMSGILTAEAMIVGQKGGRLSWPYDDLVSGNYLSKVGLPAFTIMVALAIGAKPRLASTMGGMSLFIIIISVLAGERINSILSICGGMLAALAWKPKWWRWFMALAFGALTLLSIVLISPTIHNRYIDRFIAQLPVHAGSNHYRLMATGIEASKGSFVLGLGPATYRDLCPTIIDQSSKFWCSNHPHNFYVQFITEIGITGLIAGSLMIISIVWAAHAGWRNNRENVSAATAFVIPLGLFFPIQTTGDFFGQWNNIFMWSAIALALAAARNLVPSKPR